MMVDISHQTEHNFYIHSGINKNQDQKTLVTLKLSLILSHCDVILTDKIETEKPAKSKGLGLVKLKINKFMNEKTSNSR